jgi:hypothetical protein
MRMRPAAAFVNLLFIAAACLAACGDDSTGPGGQADEAVIISSEMPLNNSLPGSAVIDTLVHLSHVEMLATCCYGDTSDPQYPQLIYIANDVVKSFAFVWLPGGWDSLPNDERRMLVHLHGHCSIGTKHFCTWYEPAAAFNIAVLSLQYWMGDEEWMGGNPSPGQGYPLYGEHGEFCGWHLNIDNDIYPFVEALAEHFSAESLLLHGFSMAAATSAIVDHRDKQSGDVIDMVVFNAGHISSSHSFLRELQTSRDRDAFSGENFFFFLENLEDDVYAKQAATRETLIAYGAADIGTEIAADSGYRHGALLNHDDFIPTRQWIMALYDSLSMK